MPPRPVSSDATSLQQEGKAAVGPGGYGARVDEQQPAPEEPFDDDVYAAGWWQHKAHIEAGRAEAADALGWAVAGICDQLRKDDPESCVSLIDHLLDSPGADPAAVGRGPLQALLEQRGAEVADRIAVFAATWPDWRAALGQVRLAASQAAAVPAVWGWLHGAVPSWARRPADGDGCRKCLAGRYVAETRRVPVDAGLYSDVDYVRCDVCRDEPPLNGYPG